MSENREREALFDQWANGYDESVRTCRGFPFAGYEAVLDEIVRRTDPKPGQRILDLGIGTGALAHRFELLGCEVWGIDFSADMLAKANARCPTAHTLQGDLLATWPSGLPHQFDRIVSGYVFYEFTLADKRLLIQRALRRAWLLVGGSSLEILPLRQQGPDPRLVRDGKVSGIPMNTTGLGMKRSRCSHPRSGRYAIRKSPSAAAYSV